jgi:hypothetical protein
MELGHLRVNFCYVQHFVIVTVMFPSNTIDFFCNAFFTLGGKGEEKTQGFVDAGFHTARSGFKKACLWGGCELFLLRGASFILVDIQQRDHILKPLEEGTQAAICCRKHEPEAITWAR